MDSRSRATEQVSGELEIDYLRNRVVFHPNDLNDVAFQLPLAPLDINIARSITRYAKARV
jgi:hypothetical protein